MQLASGFASLTVALPLPLEAAVIVTVCTRLAVSVSLLVAVKVHGFVLAVQVPPDQPPTAKPEFGVAVIVTDEPAASQ